MVKALKEGDEQRERGNGLMDKAEIVQEGGRDI